MTTNNLPGMQPGRNAMGRIAQAVRTRAAEVRQALEALDSEEENVRIGAAALLQSIEDDREPLAEEGEQLLSVLDSGRRQQSRASQPQTENTSPAVTEQPTAPVSTPASPAQTQEAPTTNNDANGSGPQAVRMSSFNHPNWGRSTRIGAVIGFVVALLVAVNTRDWLADIAKLSSGFGPWALKAVWIIALASFGYYAAGYAISMILNRTRPNPQRP